MPGCIATKYEAKGGKMGERQIFVQNLYLKTFPSFYNSFYGSLLS